MTTTFEIIKKDNKPYLRMMCGEYVYDMKIYKINTDKPYVKKFGECFELDEETKQELALIK